MSAGNPLAIEYRDTDSLIPYVNNAKQHTQTQVDQIAASIKEFGFTNPILLDGANGVIAGHGRLQAAQKLKLEQVPTIELSHLTDMQRRAYILADNRLAEVNTSWDFELVSSELEALQLEGMDIDLTGFDDGFIFGDEPEDDAEPGGEGGAGSLKARFMIPPFSVLNAREGWWQDRKRYWIAQGIQSELGRGEELIPNGGGQRSRERYAGRKSDACV